MKSGHLILMKTIKLVATRCQILRLKCTKFNFRWGSAPDPSGGAYNSPPDRLAGFTGAYFEVRSREWEGRGKGRKGKRGKGRGSPKGWLTPPCPKS